MPDAAIDIHDDDWAELITAAGPLPRAELHALLCSVGAILDAVGPDGAVEGRGSRSAPSAAQAAELDRLDLARFRLCMLKLRLGELALLVKLSRLCARRIWCLAAAPPGAAAARRATPERGGHSGAGARGPARRNADALR